MYRLDHERSAEGNTTSRRKDEHIRICVNEHVEGSLSAGFDRYHFEHVALPEIDFADISTQTEFLDKPLSAPFLVSSMTGGTPTAKAINRRLAEHAEKRGWAMAVGSMRAMLEDRDLAESFQVRRYAPSIVLLANLGLVQLNYGFTAEHCRAAVEQIEANALVFHLNSMQEVFQPEGNTNFSTLLSKLESVCSQLDIPIGVKEVGWGITGDTAAQLREAGVQFIDVSGAGGTSWSQVEKHRISDPMRRKAAETFAVWGNPTAECIRSVRSRIPLGTVIASGGITNGLDAAKAIALGADLAGIGRTLLAPAIESSEALELAFEQLEWELRVAMFGIGAAQLKELKSTARLRPISSIHQDNSL